MAGVKGRSGGNGRKPTEQKRRLGNPGGKALPDEAEIIPLRGHRDTPAPPRVLGKAGNQAWENAWFHARHWLADSDMEGVVVYCEAVDDYQALRVAMLQALDEPEGWRLRKQVIDLRGQLFQMADRLGLTPVGRSVIGVAEVRIGEAIDRLTTRAPASAKVIDVEA